MTCLLQPIRFFKAKIDMANQTTARVLDRCSRLTKGEGPIVGSAQLVSLLMAIRMLALQVYVFAQRALSTVVFGKTGFQQPGFKRNPFFKTRGNNVRYCRSVETATPCFNAKLNRDFFHQSKSRNPLEEDLLCSNIER
jgi:hypothetical protein